MPLTKLGPKNYYIGIFFKVINFYWQSLLLCHQNFAFQANWARSAQYCRYHGMHLASIDSAQVEKWSVNAPKTKTKCYPGSEKIGGAHRKHRSGPRAFLDQRYWPGRGGKVSDKYFGESSYIFLSGDNVLISWIVSDLSGCPPGSRWAGKTGMRGNQTITSNGLKTVSLWSSKYFFRYEGGEREHCLELWNRDGKVRVLLKFSGKF